MVAEPTDEVSRGGQREQVAALLELWIEAEVRLLSEMTDLATTARERDRPQGLCCLAGGVTCHPTEHDFKEL